MENKSSAFTLIELLMTISIIFIIVGYALPTFNDLLEKQKVNANVQRLAQTLQLSRTKAITENIKITLCPIDQDSNCSSNWSTGYMSFVDNNGDRQYNNDDIILYQFMNKDEASILKWRAFGINRSLQWLETGITNHQNGSFEFCYANKPDKSRGLFLTKTGRIRYSKDTNGDKIHENATGDAIHC